MRFAESAAWIAARHGNDPKRLVEHYIEYQKQVGDRLLPPPDETVVRARDPRVGMWETPMHEECCVDPALEEIWAIREKIAAEFDYDVHKLCEFYREFQKQFGDRLIRAPEQKKRKKPTA